MAKIEPFEKHFNEYDKWFDDNKIIYQSELIAVKKLLPPVRGLEIGIGTGRFAIPLGIKDGVEPSLNMREIALKRGLNVPDGVAENLPFSDREYDFVLLTTTLCFLDDADKAVKEIYRVLKPNGRLIICIIDKDSPVGKIYLKNKDENPFYKYAKFYSTDEVIELLSMNNFKNFDVFQTLFGSLESIGRIQKPKKGHGKGLFVVIKALKNN